MRKALVIIFALSVLLLISCKEKPEAESEAICEICEKDKDICDCNENSLSEKQEAVDTDSSLKDSGADTSDIQCSFCGENGHIIAKCPYLHGEK